MPVFDTPAPTFDDVWRMFQETDLRAEKLEQELARRAEEFDRDIARSRKEFNRQIKELNN